jgi:hypothetical protein
MAALTATVATASPDQSLSAPSPRRRTVRAVLWLLVLVAAGLVVVTTVLHVRRVKQHEENAHAAARQKAVEATGVIEATLNRVSPLATRLADDLSSGALKPAELPARLRADLTKDPQIFELGVAYLPHAMDPRVTLYAPHASRAARGIDVFPLEQRYDYTTYDWFTAGLKGAGWGEPYFGAATRQLVVGYAVPFYRAGDTARTTPIGVARVNLSLDNVRALVSSVSMGQTGYGFLMSKRGVLLSHPVDDYVRHGRTMVDVARELHNDARVEMTERALRGEPTEGLVGSTVTRATIWLVHQPVALNGWVFGIALLPEEIALGERDQRRGLIQILCCGMLLAWAVSLIGYRVEDGSHAALWRAAITAGVVLLFGISTVWWLTLSYPDRNGEQSIHILDEAALQKFLNAHEHILKADTAPLQVPTGMIVRTVRMIDANDVVITGNVWIRMTAGGGIEPPVLEMPDAEALELRDQVTLRRGGDDVTSWLFKATLREPSEWSRKYPFDRALMRLRVVAKPSATPVALVPDLSSYQLLTPSELPGVEKTMILPGWTVDHSYFSYTSQSLGTTSAAPSNDDQRLPYDLAFNVVTARRFLDPFVSSVLPIIVIVCLLFGLLIVVSKNNAKVAATGFKATDVLRASVALLFPALVAQVNLRSRIGATEIIYIEYFYFILYVAILAVAANALTFTLRGSGVSQVRDNLIPKLAFWPAILGACFAVTLVFLY